MNLLRPSLAAALAALALAPLATAGDSSWHPDLLPALEKAKAENKDLLVDFTGSDWCGWCIKLDEEVFAKDEFRAYADEHFVLVALDFPTQDGETWKAMPEDLHARNSEHQAAFNIQGFPTILLMTAEGVAYGRTGYQPGGPEAYNEHLDEFRTGDERTMLTAAVKRLRTRGEAAQGERLEAAYELYGNVAGDLRTQVLDTVRSLDPQDSHLVLARESLGEWKERYLKGAEPDWDAMKADAAKLRTTRPSIDKVAEFHLWLGFAYGMTDELEQADACLERLEELDDGSDPMIAQMKGGLANMLKGKRAMADEG